MIIDQDFGAIPDHDLRRRAWQDAISPLYRCDIDREDPVAIGIGMRSYNLRRCLFGASRSPTMRVERSIEQISRQGVDHLLMRVFLTGQAHITVNGRSFDVGAGTFQVFDLSQHMVSETDEKSILHVVLPRRAFEKRLGDVSERHGHVFAADLNPVTRLLKDHLGNLAGCIDAVGDGQRDSLAQATVAMCNAVLTDMEADHPYRRETLLGLAVRQAIEGDLASTDLGIEKLCARFGLSRTGLYALFEGDGGVARYIRERRLARAMRLLADGGGRRRVSSVGYEMGFETEKMFSRAFRRRYGINPSEVGRAHMVDARLEYGATLRSWIEEL